MRSPVRRTGLVLLLAGLLAACTSGGADPVSRAPASPSAPAVPSALVMVGSWRVSGTGVAPGTALLLGEQLVLFRRCGVVEGDWRAGSTGLFVSTVNGGDPTCVSKRGFTPAPWLEQAVGFRVDGDQRELLDARGAVLARLAPGAHPTAPPNMAASYASPPAVTPALRARLADPAPLPAGVRPATSATLVGRWLPTSPRRGNPKAYVAFLRSGTWSGSDGCNGNGGRYALGEGGALLTTSGFSTLVGCNNSPVDVWVTQAARAGLDGSDLVLYDRAGRLLGALSAGLSPATALRLGPSFGAPSR